jgi:2-iminoacetate synthase ThiH
MQNDHLEDALLFLRHALQAQAEYGRFDEFSITRAIEEIEAEMRDRTAPDLSL